jgi:hypothetical protein
LVLVNGAAVIALLTFIGNLASKDDHTAKLLVAGGIVVALRWFAGGLFFAVMTAIAGYISALYFARSIPLKRVRRAALIRAIAMGPGFASAAAFGWGVWKSGAAFAMAFGG